LRREKKQESIALGYWNLNILHYHCNPHFASFPKTRNTKGGKERSSRSEAEEVSTIEYENKGKDAHPHTRISPSSRKRITVVVASVANKVADIKAMRASW
jgi:hypothetical protein